MDLETCSWCLDEVEFKTLTEAQDGALICKNCKREVRDKPLTFSERFI